MFIKAKVIANIENWCNFLQVHLFRIVLGMCSGYVLMEKESKAVS